MSQPPMPAIQCDARDGECHLCGDVAVWGCVVEIDAATRTALVTMGGELVTVALDLVDADEGDDVLVHMGFAIERLVRA